MLVIFKIQTTYILFNTYMNELYVLIAVIINILL